MGRGIKHVYVCGVLVVKCFKWERIVVKTTQLSVNFDQKFDFYLCGGVGICQIK